MSPSVVKSRYWDQLLQFLDEGRVIPILGRELLTVPEETGSTHLYPFLAKRLAEYLDVSPDELPAGRELNEVACRFRNGPQRGDPEDVYAALKSVMPAPDELPIPEPLVKLASILPLKLYVTTTFDPLLERALNAARFGGSRKTEVLAYSPQAPADLPCEVKKLDRPTVYHLLGRLSVVPDYAVTDEDKLEFIHALQEQANRPALLFDEFYRQQILLIGSGFPDWLTRFFIRATSGDRLSVAGGKNYLADAAVSENEALLAFLRNFSTRTKVYEDGGPVEFVDELHARWTARQGEGAAGTAAPAGDETPPRMEPGAVFLSYASEDRESALVLRDELEAAGVDVWFDRDDLQAGDAYADVIKNYIEDCSLFLPLISRHTLTPERRFFRIEWTYACREVMKKPASRAFIIPIGVDDTDRGHRDLPQEFRDAHWAELAGGRCAPELVARIVEIYRNHQKEIARSA